MAQGTSAHAAGHGDLFLAQEEPQLSDRQMKRLPLMRALLTILVGFVVLTTATAQTSTDPNEGSRLTYDSLVGSYDFSWWGQPGRTYFIQHSDDLSAWEYLPLIESGTNGLLSWGFTSTASKFFIRLRYSDIPTSDPFNDDFDGDKISNSDEVVLGTDPLSAVDPDANGLPDDWERFYFGHTGVDPNATAPGGGMTNLQHFQLGSNPNNAPPPPTITADTATLDQNADTLLYPADDSQLLLQNGNFSATSLGSDDWNTFSGITGWTAISGSLIELQQIEVNTTAGAGQYCELDSHWPTDNHSGDSDHGIQQTVSLARGRYVLFFDYRGRNATARSFTVKARTGINLPGLPQPTEYLLATENAASTIAWKRASTTFEVTGGNPNLATLPITLIFDIADAADSYGAYIDNVLLLPVEIAPDLLPVNRGFGEGNLDGLDARDNVINSSLKAQRDTVDGRFKTGDFVTEDIRKGWFGVSPFALDATFFDGATVTIRKVIKRDSTGKVIEKGHVRFSATWGGGGEKQIIAYREANEIDGGETLPLNLVGPVYGSSATVPRTAELWMEGFYPGKITLEFRLQKGTLDFKYEQTFEVGCDWSKAKWQAVVRDEMFIMGAAAQRHIDVNDYAVANGFMDNRKFLDGVFNYYGGLFLRNQSKYYWAGLAKLAGGPIYAALSDAEIGAGGFTIPSWGVFDAAGLRQIQNALTLGNLSVFKDIAFQHVAHRTSGVRALELLEERGEIPQAILEKWQAIGDPRDDIPATVIQERMKEILEREQKEILVPCFNQLNTMKIAGVVSVPWILSFLSKSPNGTPDFDAVVPAGNICNTAARWSWIAHSSNGMWAGWCNASSQNRHLAVEVNFMDRSRAFSRVWPFLPFLTPDVNLPP
jgi:hypothetical protein